MTNEELLSAGVGDLQDTVAAGRRRFIGHVPCLPMSRPASLDSRAEVEDGAGQSGHGRIHLEKMCRKWASVAVALMMKLGVLPVTVPDVDNSLPSISTGAGGPESK